MLRTYGNIHYSVKNQTSNIPTNYIEIYQTLIINWHCDKDLMKIFIAAPAWAGARCSSLKLWRRRGINEQAIKTFIANIWWSKTDNSCWGCTEVIKSAHEYMCSSTTTTFHFNWGVPKPTNFSVEKEPPTVFPTRHPATQGTEGKASTENMQARITSSFLALNVRSRMLRCWFTSSANSLTDWAPFISKCSELHSSLTETKSLVSSWERHYFKTPPSSWWNFYQYSHIHVIWRRFRLLRFVTLDT